MNIVLGIIIGIVILMLLVVAHEFGHFIMARRNGVKVLEFGIGFPPRAKAWIKKGGKWHKLPKSDWDQKQDSTILSLNWLPIGGFCSMDGESAADTRKGTFGAANFWSKTKILFGGVLMNWLVAFVLLTILAFTGMPQFLNNQFYLSNDANISGEGVTVREVMANSPAEQAGFQTGDQILAVGDTKIMYPTDVTAYGQDHAGQEVKYQIKRDNETQDLTVKLNSSDANYLLGVSMSFGQTFIRSTWSAPARLSAVLES